MFAKIWMIFDLRSDFYVLLLRSDKSVSTYIFLINMRYICNDAQN